jgi:hypothetical protein
MYGIFTDIWVIFRGNVGKYSIHGAFGYGIEWDFFLAFNVIFMDFRRFEWE